MQGTKGNDEAQRRQIFSIARKKAADFTFGGFI